MLNQLRNSGYGYQKSSEGRNEVETAASNKKDSDLFRSQG